MTHRQLEKYLLKKPGAWLDYPFGETAAVYKVGSKTEAKMFALINEGSDPAVISLKCDPVLAETLRAEYEVVMPGYHLPKKHWNTIVTSGQLDDEYLLTLVDLSYRLVVETLPAAQQARLTAVD